MHYYQHYNNKLAQVQPHTWSIRKENESLNELRRVWRIESTLTPKFTKSKNWPFQGNQFKRYIKILDPFLFILKVLDNKITLIKMVRYKSRK